MRNVRQPPSRTIWSRFWPVCTIPRLPTRFEHGDVSLHAYEQTDAAPLFVALNHYACWEHIPRPIPRTAESLDQQVTKMVQDGQRVTYVICWRALVVGMTSVIDIGDPEAVEIGGTQLNPTAWGSGVNRLAKNLVSTAIFQAGRRWIQIRTDERNKRSAAAIRALGATDMGVRQDALVRRDGTIRRSIFFRLAAPPSLAPTSSTKELRVR